MKPIDKLLANLRKDLPDTPIYKASDFKSTGFISLGLIELDRSLRGGISEGSLNIFYGEPHSGKSTVALLAVAAIQKKYPEGLVVYIDSENAFPENDGDNYWPKLLGCDMDRITLIQENESSKVSDIIDAISQQPEVKLIVLDSIGTLVSSKELDEATSDSQVANVAKDMSKMINKFVHNLLTSRRNGNGEKTLIVINHFRDKIGGRTFVPVEVLPGGTKQTYSAKTQIKFGKASINKKTFKDSVSDDELVEYSEHNFKIRKHRGGDYVATGVFQLKTHYEGDGTNPVKTNLDQVTKALSYAKSYGFVVENANNTFDLKTNYETTIEGLDNLVNFITSTEDIFDDLLDCIVMVDRGRGGKSILPQDNWLRCYHKEVPKQVYEAIKQFGLYKTKPKRKPKGKKNDQEVEEKQES